MHQFSVWLRPLGRATKVRVAGEENGRWLRDQILLGGAGCGEIRLVTGSDQVQFLAYHTPQVDGARLRSLIAEFPRVLLQLDPA